MTSSLVGKFEKRGTVIGETEPKDKGGCINLSTTLENVQEPSIRRNVTTVIKDQQKQITAAFRTPRARMLQPRIDQNITDFSVCGL